METEYSAIYIGREAKQKLGLGILLWLQLEKKRVKKYLKIVYFKERILVFYTKILFQKIMRNFETMDPQM